MASWTNSNKNTSTFTNRIRRGRDLVLNEIKDLTFEDALLEDGTKVKDTTFSQLQDQSWSNQSKSASPTFSNVTRN